MQKSHIHDNKNIFILSISVVIIAMPIQYFAQCEANFHKIGIVYLTRCVTREFLGKFPLGHARSLEALVLQYSNTKRTTNRLKFISGIHRNIIVKVKVKVK